MQQDTSSYGKIRELQRRIAVYEDEAAYKELFLMLFSSLTRFAASILRSKELAEEVVSDVFIQIWNNRGSIGQIEDLRLYLFIATKNNAVARYKQVHKQNTISLDELEMETASLYINPEERVMSAEMVRTIEQAIEQLPPKARIIFKLAKEDRLKYKDIASLLNISVKTVDHQLAISLKKIGKAIGTVIRKKS